MIYQKIFTDEMPYRISIGVFSKFPEHRHADLEFNYCIEGSFDIIIDKKLYRINGGCMTLISPMSSHQIPPQADNKNRVLTMILGTSFLKGYFARFSKSRFKSAFCDLKDEKNRELFELITEIVNLSYLDGDAAGLMMMGNVYKVCACLISHLFEPGEQTETAQADFHKVECIEKALDLIYYNYKECLTVEYAAQVTGYGKSNFCKIFKEITGESFHQALNRQRISTACGLLAETNLSVSDISTEVGFYETKAFCRVFKDIMGDTPGGYRKKRRIY